MTTTTTDEVSVRRPGRPRRPRSFAADFCTLGREILIEVKAVALPSGWPSDRYRTRPVEFFREVLGVEPWSKQIEVIEAIRDHKRVAVKSGHKVSKSHTCAGVALWFFCSFPDARVVLTSTTSRQVDQILWRELTMLHTRAGRCVDCKKLDKERAGRGEPLGPKPCPHSAIPDGTPRMLARTGMKSADFREIVGFTAREAEAVAGVSGKNLLYLPDEASGIADSIFEAIEGNRAGGARIAMFSNPTKTEGEFFEAFNSKAELYHCITISSADSPNVVTGEEVIPGLATREWVEEKRQEWGEDSPLYKIRVKGEFVLSEDGKVLSVHAITESEKRWSDASDAGRLCVGIDPAGPGGTGDESAFAVRRAQKVLPLITLRGLSEEAHLVHLLGILGEHRQKNELPLVIVDREGPIGSRVWNTLREHADQHPMAFEVIGVRSSDRASRERQNYDRVRDELWANLVDWIRNGGAIPSDAKLAKELHAPEWFEQIAGRLKVTSKEDLRKLLKRSPDRADAVALAVWQQADAPPEVPQAEKDSPDPENAPLDPYSGSNPWRGQS